MDSDCKGGSSISSSKMKQGKHHQLTKFFSIKTMPKRAQKSDEPTNKVAPVMKQQSIDTFLDRTKIET